MELIKPREEFFDEYYEACKESYENNVTEWMPFELDNFNQWKKHILKAYDNYETGTDLPEGLPRTYTYWCVENGKFIGEVQLRPFLNKEEEKSGDTLPMQYVILGGTKAGEQNYCIRLY